MVFSALSPTSRNTCVSCDPLPPCRARSHEEAERNFEVKLAGMRTAVDAWLVRSRSAPSPGATTSTPVAASTASACPLQGAGSSAAQDAAAAGGQQEASAAAAMQLAISAIGALKSAPGAASAGSSTHPKGNGSSSSDALGGSSSGVKGGSSSSFAGGRIAAAAAAATAAAAAAAAPAPPAAGTCGPTVDCEAPKVAKPDEHAAHKRARVATWIKRWGHMGQRCWVGLLGGACVRLLPFPATRPPLRAQPSCTQAGLPQLSLSIRLASIPTPRTPMPTLNTHSPLHAHPAAGSAATMP